MELKATDDATIPTWETLATYSVLIVVLTLITALLAAGGSFVFYHLTN